MCYDVSFTLNIRQVQDYFPDLVFDEQLDLDFFPMDHVQGVGVFPHYPVLYRDRSDHKIHLKEMEWSVMEFFLKTEPSIAKRNGMLNIRSERVLDDAGSYWYKIRNRRCLMPVTGIYEHRAIKHWKKKVPYLIREKSQEIFFLPGLYSVANIADTSTGEILERWTFAIMTRKANALMQNIHNDGDNRHRMPLFLPIEKAKQFLNEDLDAETYRSILNYEAKDDELIPCPVFTIRSPKGRPDMLAKTAYYAWENLPALGVDNPD